MAWLATYYSRVDGVRKPATPLLPGNTLASFLPLTGVLCVVLLAILADQSTINSEASHQQPDNGAGGGIHLFAPVTAAAGWMGPQRRQLWLWLPILLPALPLVAGQYTLALWLNLDGKLDGGGLGASAVGNAVDAVYPATRLAAH